MHVCATERKGGGVKEKGGKEGRWGGEDERGCMFVQEKAGGGGGVNKKGGKSGGGGRERERETAEALFCLYRVNAVEKV